MACSEGIWPPGNMYWWIQLCPPRVASMRSCGMVIACSPTRPRGEGVPGGEQCAGIGHRGVEELGEQFVGQVLVPLDVVSGAFDGGVLGGRLGRDVPAAQRLQSGRLDAYLAYMLIALVALLALVSALA